MIKTFEEYKSKNTYTKVNAGDYRRIINGDDSENWTINKEFLEKNVEDFVQSEIKLIESLDLDVKVTKIVDVYDDYDGDYNIKKIEIYTNCQRLVLYKKDIITPKILITKIQDEYFMVDNFYNKQYGGRKVIAHDYYKCDQIDGLINCLKNCIDD